MALNPTRLLLSGCMGSRSIAEILAGIRNVSRLGLSNAPKGFFRRLGAKINFLLIFPTKPAPLRRRIHRLQSKAISAAFYAAWVSRLS
jgi:hypothetical protein